MIEFDWKSLDKGISITELSRSKKADETVITFRLLMNAPSDEQTTTRYVILTPFDKRVRPLTIPVVCSRPSLRVNEAAQVLRPDRISLGAIPRDPDKKSNEPAPLLRPDRIGLGVIPRGEERVFQVFGTRTLVSSVMLAGFDGLPEATTFELRRINDKEKDSRLVVAFRVGTSAPLGPLDGRIRLTTPEGREHSIAVLGIVGPADSVEKSNEAKHGTNPGREPALTLSPK